MTDWRTVSDLELLTRALAHDEPAWRALVARYRGLLYRCITKVTNRYPRLVGPQDVDEIYADVYLNLVRDDMHKLRSFDATRGTKLSSWLGMIAIHTTYDFLRSRTRQPQNASAATELPELAAPSSDPETVLLAREECSKIERMLSEFSDRDRTFVDLYFAREMDPEAIARAMRISVKTVYSKKNKIRNRLLELGMGLRGRELGAAA